MSTADTWIEKFDPDNPNGPTFLAWKQSIALLVYSQERLSKFLDTENVPVPVATEGETPAALSARLERHISDGYRASLLVRHNVSSAVAQQLEITWSASRMMTHLTNTYGGTIAVNLAVKWEEYHNFTGDPMTIAVQIQKLEKEMADICATKQITTVPHLLSVISNLELVRHLDIPPYNDLRDQLIASDNIATVTVEYIRNQMISLKTSYDANKVTTAFVATGINNVYTNGTAPPRLAHPAQPSRSVGNNVSTVGKRAT
ncbi:hypothetical protein SeMB42_g00020 [Synchytrium endobioticum]|uniref:Uncharacterized protein n=1 Tax=Synchytrium endobioticum TaxID=286115 RepID=A0A507DTC3_9FUNG|nr:hypothetical protein SeLEV6574_g02056 [Synchytrium endobioticum]TPX54999.1 hypothetical protein SeMB42_g00020 [Synchytrium endobioticum]